MITKTMNQGKHISKTIDALFEAVKLQNITLKNRIIRSATYEGFGDPNGVPRSELADIYLKLAKGGVGAIITGFVFVSQTGRAMQPGQCGIDTPYKISPWQKITDKVHTSYPDVSLFMQIAHTGRQTKSKYTGNSAVGPSGRKCTYFKEPVKILNDAEILEIIDEFGEAARRAREAGFDGIQVHAAHGYLIHQFLSQWTNTRRDKWADGNLFLESILENIHQKCGADFPVFVKLSWADDNNPGVSLKNTIQTVKRLEKSDIDAIEISYGTMEFALNIIRGDCPIDIILKVNPLFNQIPLFFREIWKRFFLKKYLKKNLPFAENYNIDSALKIKKATTLPVFSVGGIRTIENMIEILNKGLDAVSLCRPLICEPDLAEKLKNGKNSECINCNLCTVYCDSTQSLRCYQSRKVSSHEYA